MIGFLTGFLIDSLSIGLIPSVVYSYWKILDRTLTDIKLQSDWFRRNYEGTEVHGEYVTGTIAYVRCYYPDSRYERLKRYCGKDNGRTEITLIFDSEVSETVWEECEDLIEMRGFQLNKYNNERGKCIVKLEYAGFDHEKPEEIAQVATDTVNEFYKDRSGLTDNEVSEETEMET